MVDDEVLLADGSEAVAAMVAHPLGIARIVGDEFEVRPVETHELGKLAERKDAVDQEYLVVAAGERPLHEAPQLDRHRRLDFETDHRSAPAALEHGLELAHQVFRLFLDLDLGIADHPEGALPFDRIAGEQASDEQAGRLLEGNDPRGGRSVGARQPDEALGAVGNADQRIHRLAVAGARKVQRNGEAEIGDERERMRRVDGERREQRKDLPQEVILEPALFLLRDVGAVDQHDALLGQHPAKLEPALLLVGPQHRDRLADAGELLGGGETIRRLGGDAGAQLTLEAGNADHEELVEIIGRNRQEPDPLEQRMGLVGRLFEHPSVEMEPGQLTVDKSFGARQKVEGWRGLGPGGGRDRHDFLFQNNSLAAVNHGPQGAFLHRARMAAIRELKVT